MSWSHLLLALSVVFIWGTNFVVIRWGLDGLPPFLFATLRFALSALPWLLFIRRPAVRWRTLAAFGVLLGVGQFGLMFLAMQGRITPGLASLVIQTQVFFTIALSLLALGERVRGFQLGGLALVLAAALFWACANLVAKSAGRVDMLGFMVWSSVFAVPPLLALSWLLEGPQAMAAGLAGAGTGVWAAVLWQALGNSLYGYGVWNWLLARHPAATVTPLALLVPVFGISASALALGEPLPAWKLGAGALVLLGLVVIVLWPRARAWLAAR